MLQLWDVSVPLLRGGELVPRCCNVSLADVMTIPPLSEALVPVNILTPAGAGQPAADFEGYLEPNIPETTGLVVVHTVSSVKRTEIEHQVAELLADGVVEESCSPWASPVVHVKKKGGQWRFCVDYRRLNAVTVKDSHPLPRVDDSLDALAGSAWFSTLDFSNGYWQVEMAEEDREKTAFTTGRGLYQWRAMPMGLTNSPAMFQRMMVLILRGLPWHICMVYLDDILIYNRTFTEHLLHLDEVLSRIQLAGLKLNPRKCHFARDHVVFLGHVVSRDGIQPDPRNTDKVRTWPTPRTPSEVRAFVGLCSYYRRFVCGFSSALRH